LKSGLFGGDFERFKRTAEQLHESVLLASRPIFMQKTIGATLLEIVPDERAILGITADGRWW
jgi:hypothetical protein